MKPRMLFPKMVPLLYSCVVLFFLAGHARGSYFLSKDTAYNDQGGLLDTVVILNKGPATVTLDSVIISAVIEPEQVSLRIVFTTEGKSGAEARRFFSIECQTPAPISPVCSLKTGTRIFMKEFWGMVWIVPPSAIHWWDTVPIRSVFHFSPGTKDTLIVQNRPSTNATNPLPLFRNPAVRAAPGRARAFDLLGRAMRLPAVAPGQRTGNEPGFRILVRRRESGGQ